MTERFSCPFIVDDKTCRESQGPCDIKDQREFGSLSYLGWKQCAIYLRWVRKFSCPDYLGDHTCSEGTVVGFEECDPSYGINPKAWETCIVYQEKHKI